MMSDSPKIWRLDTLNTGGMGGQEDPCELLLEKSHMLLRAAPSPWRRSIFFPVDMPQRGIGRGSFAVPLTQYPLVLASFSLTLHASSCPVLGHPVSVGLQVFVSVHLKEPVPQNTCVEGICVIVSSPWEVL